MIVGAVVAGPIGLVAGSFLGSSAAQTSMRAVGGDPNANKEDGDDNAPDQGGSGTCHSRLVHEQAPDLLSSSTGSVCNTSTSARVNSSAVPTATNARAEYVGDIATANHRTVMVQAQMIDPLSSYLLDTNSQFSQVTIQDAISTTGTYNGHSSPVPSQLHQPNPLAMGVSSSHHFPESVQGSHPQMTSTTTQSTIPPSMNPVLLQHGQSPPRHHPPPSAFQADRAFVGHVVPAGLLHARLKLDAVLRRGFTVDGHREPMHTAFPVIR